MGNAIRAERRRLGVTQEELAWRADMHRTYLADIERGVRNVTLKSIGNLARALEVSVSHLLAKPDPANATKSHPERVEEILLIEDNAADGEMTVRAFSKAGIANPIKVARSGRLALDYLFCAGRFARRQPTNPELVLLDLQLPDISGLDVLRQIRSDHRTKHIPVVVLTISRDDQNIIECSRLGAENYVIKPVGFESFSQLTPKLNLQWTLAHSPSAMPRKARI
ncbi:MAG TPA: response regulator [Lacunisphaera sp.]|nr:response regulator [Lacunisphaera sp.]